jgi:hypothetical protein
MSVSGFGDFFMSIAKRWLWWSGFGRRRRMDGHGGFGRRRRTDEEKKE